MMDAEHDLERVQRWLAGLLSSVLAFAAGFLVADCRAAQSLEEASVEPLLAAAPQCAEVQCPPENVEVAPQPRGTLPRRIARTKRPARLPEPAASPDADRDALLDWVRSETPSLRRCFLDEQMGHRLTARLRLDQDGRTTAVFVRPHVGELAPETTSCLRTGLRRWRVPQSLRSHHRELVFALRI